MTKKPSMKAELRDSPRLTELFWRAIRLRCPTCGQGRLFRSWLSMREPCESCGRRFDRSPGFLLGSIYVNYGVTTLLVVVIYFSLFLTHVMTGGQLLIAMSAFSLLFPLWFFRYARALWIALDEQFDPWPNEQEAREQAKKK